jgi:hypothetical protein
MITKMTDALKGAIVALVSSFFVALLFAYLFRLPVPMGGMIGPFGEFSTYGMAIGDVFMSVIFAWVFYGIFGGFIILPLCGAIAGVAAGRKYSGTNGRNRMIVLWSGVISTIPVLALSTLDYVMGPW